jgi:hypothetical protein
MNSYQRDRCELYNSSMYPIYPVLIDPLHWNFNLSMNILLISHILSNAIMRASVFAKAVETGNFDVSI